MPRLNPYLPSVVPISPELAKKVFERMAQPDQIVLLSQAARLNRDLNLSPPNSMAVLAAIGVFLVQANGKGGLVNFRER